MFCVPQKITLEDLSESKSALEEKSGDRSHSVNTVNSMQTATHETTNVAVYEVGHTALQPVCKNAERYVSEGGRHMSGP